MARTRFVDENFSLVGDDEVCEVTSAKSDLVDCDEMIDVELPPLYQLSGLMPEAAEVLFAA